MTQTQITGLSVRHCAIPLARVGALGVVLVLGSPVSAIAQDPTAIDQATAPAVPFADGAVAPGAVPPAFPVANPVDPGRAGVGAPGYDPTLGQGYDPTVTPGYVPPPAAAFDATATGAGQGVPMAPVGVAPLAAPRPGMVPGSATGLSLALEPLSGDGPSPTFRDFNDLEIASYGLATFLQQLRVVQNSVAEVFPQPPFDTLTLDALVTSGLLPDSMTNGNPGDVVTHHYGGVLRLQGKDNAFALQIEGVPGFACRDATLNLASALGQMSEPSALVVNGHLATTKAQAALAALHCQPSAGNVLMLRFEGKQEARELEDLDAPQRLSEAYLAEEAAAAERAAAEAAAAEAAAAQAAAAEERAGSQPQVAYLFNAETGTYVPVTLGYPQGPEQPPVIYPQGMAPPAAGQAVAAPAGMPPAAAGMVDPNTTAPQPAAQTGVPPIPAAGMIPPPLVPGGAALATAALAAPIAPPGMPQPGVPQPGMPQPGMPQPMVPPSATVVQPAGNAAADASVAAGSTYPTLAPVQPPGAMLPTTMGVMAPPPVAGAPPYAAAAAYPGQQPLAGAAPYAPVPFAGAPMPAAQTGMQGGFQGQAALDDLLDLYRVIDSQYGHLPSFEGLSAPSLDERSLIPDRIDASPEDNNDGLLRGSMGPISFSLQPGQPTRLTITLHQVEPLACRDLMNRAATRFTAELRGLESISVPAGSFLLAINSPDQMNAACGNQPVSMGFVFEKCSDTTAGTPRCQGTQSVYAPGPFPL